MKIAYWNSGFFSGYGGAELCTAELINKLAERGETCFLLANKPELGGSSIQTPALDKRIVVRLGVFHNPLHYRKNPILLLYKMFSYTLSALTLFIWLVRNRVDVIHLHFVSLDVVMLILFKRLLGYRLVLTFHGLELELASESALSNWKNRLALRHADQVTAVSRHQCDVLRKLNPESDIHFIPNAVDVDKIHRLVQQPSHLPIQAGHFVYCGRVDPEKQVPGLVGAFAMAVRQGCSRNLYIMGDGAEDTRMRTVIKQLGLTDRVCPLGAQNRHLALRMIKESWCLLLNSASEGHPLIILEAMVLGKPVIAPDIGGIGEMVKNADNILLFPVGDEQALCSAILSMDNDAEHINRPGDNVEARSRGPVNLDVVLGKYRNLYLACE